VAYKPGTKGGSRRESTIKGTLVAASEPVQLNVRHSITKKKRRMKESKAQRVQSWQDCFSNLAGIRNFSSVMSIQYPCDVTVLST
jgi:hypothetical protein